MWSSFQQINYWNVKDDTENVAGADAEADLRQVAVCRQEISSSPSQPMSSTHLHGTCEAAAELTYTTKQRRVHCAASEVTEIGFVHSYSYKWYQNEREYLLSFIV